MNTKTIAIVGLGSVLFTGCATFDHQTAETEPHALITIVQPWENQAGTLKKFDGMSVSAGKTYRVRPGKHTVVMAFKERSFETYKPTSYHLIGSGIGSERPANLHISESGQATVSGLDPSQSMQSVNLSYERTQIRLATNSITVEAGVRYQLQGDKLTEK
jgi:hypothetical protein